MNNKTPFQRSPRLRPLAIAAITAVLAVAGASTTLLHSDDAQANAPAAAPAAMPVSVAAVAASEVSTWDEYSGRLEAVQRVELRSRVAGAVQSVHFREGSLVKAGDLLVTIDPAPYAAEAERAQAQVVAAQARLSHAQSEQQRAARLWDERAIAQRELDERVSAARTAEADLRAAQAALQASKLQLSYTQVRAPIAGRIGRIEITPGNLVAAGPGAPVLATLVSVSPIYASFDAAEGPGSAARAAKGAVPVELGTAGADGTPIKGRLQLVDNQVDARSGTLRLRAVFDNADGSLMPGQFARIRLGQPSTRQALLVSERAIGTDQDKRFVMVVAPDNTAQYREVALGASVDGLRVVTKGLKEGERIVVNGLQRVRPGALVAPQVVPMDARTNGTPTRVAAR